VLAEPADDAADVREADFLAGMTLFTHANAPWTALTDRARFAAVLDTIGALDVAHLYSAHAPAVHDKVDAVLRHMHTVPDRPACLPEAAPVPAALAAHDLRAREPNTRITEGAGHVTRPRPQLLHFARRLRNG
jgi:hypothetical protein